MKKLLTCISTLVMVLAICVYAFAATAPALTSAVTGTVSTVFSVVFYPRTGIDKTDENIQFPNGQVVFGAIDPTKSIVYPTGRSESDGKSDVGILGLCNTGASWGLKMHQTGIPSDNFGIYIPAAAYNRNVDPAEVLGGLQHSEGWYKAWTSAHTVYIADASHKNTLPWGTLLTFSFAVVPTGKLVPDLGETFDGSPLPSGPVNVTVYYTMTTSL